MYAGVERSALGGSRDTMTDLSALNEKAQDAPRAGATSGPQEWRRRLPFALGLVSAVLSLCSGLSTYLILTGLTPIAPTEQVRVWVLLINLVLVLAMIAIIAWQVTRLWRARRRQAAGAQLHVRIVSLFSVIAVFPAILLAIFASVSLSRGLDYWLSDRTKSIVQNSIDVAMAYLKEHSQVIRADAFGMARDIDETVELGISMPQGFDNFLATLAATRSFPIAYLIDGEGRIRNTAASLPNVPYIPPVEEVIATARDNDSRVFVLLPD
jgi:two-component system nitrogen regulation sensor histidine kinase NtrY